MKESTFAVENISGLSAVANRVKLPLVVIVGPTSSGKTELAIRIAKKFNGEIISADSRAIVILCDVIVPC